MFCGTVDGITASRRRTERPSMSTASGCATVLGAHGQTSVDEHVDVVEHEVEAGASLGRQPPGVEIVADRDLRGGLEAGPHIGAVVGRPLGKGPEHRVVDVVRLGHLVRHEHVVQLRTCGNRGVEPPATEFDERRRHGVEGVTMRRRGRDGDPGVRNGEADAGEPLRIDRRAERRSVERRRVAASGPAVAASALASSSGSRATKPTVSNVGARGTPPRLEIRPGVVFSP